MLTQGQLSGERQQPQGGLRRGVELTLSNQLRQLPFCRYEIPRGELGLGIVAPGAQIIRMVLQPGARNSECPRKIEQGDV